MPVADLVNLDLEFCLIECHPLSSHIAERAGETGLPVAIGFYAERVERHWSFLSVKASKSVHYLATELVRAQPNEFIGWRKALLL